MIRAVWIQRASNSNILRAKICLSFSNHRTSLFVRNFDCFLIEPLTIFVLNSFVALNF